MLEKVAQYLQSSLDSVSVSNDGKHLSLRGFVIIQKTTLKSKAV